MTTLDIMDFGAIGDGMADDTEAVERAMSAAAKTGDVEVTSTGKSHRMTRPVRAAGVDVMVTRVNFTLDFPPQPNNVGPFLVPDEPQSPIISGLASKYELDRAERTMLTHK